jgi:Ankyrin repeats (3 copies)
LHAVLHLKEPSQRIVKHVVEKTPTSSLLKQDASGRTPLHLAIRKTSLPFELVQLIIKRGPGALRKADKCGLLPLHVALASRRTSTLKYTECLVKECAESLQVQDRAGRTPLAVASASDAPLDVVHFLLVAWPQALLHFRAEPFVPYQVRRRSVRASR